jgi:hypothetical protein
MSITKKVGRQEVIAAKVDFTFGTGANVSAVAVYPAIDLPEGAIVVGGYINISDATTATVDVNIGDDVLSTRYATAVDGAAVALTALVPTGYIYPVANTIDVAITVAAAAAAGTAELVVLYIVDGRTEFSQG